VKPTRTRHANGHRLEISPRAQRVAVVIFAVWLLGWTPTVPAGLLPLPTGAPVVAAGLFHDVQPHGADTAQTPEHAAEGEAGAHEAQSPWALVARLFNFLLLAGTLIYFLRSPLQAFLKARGVEIRASLEAAAALKIKAAQQIEDVERRLAALPAEIAALEVRGAAEVAAEEARITSAAEAERARLVEQARRQIDLQLRVARRDLAAHAADVAVGRAAQRIKATIKDEDERRLMDTYLARVAPPPAGPNRGAATGSRP